MASSSGDRADPGVERPADDDAQGRLRRVRRRLLGWGREHYQQYSWRSETDPWLTLIAETFLQRTSARQAERAFDNFRVAFPTPGDLVNAGPSAVRTLTDKLGLHWRGPLLFSAAERIAATGGSPPEDEAALRALPGVGPYAAAAWLSLHRGRRAVIVDSNVARWLCRMEGKGYTAETRRKRWVAELADRLTPKRDFRAYNYAVLDFTMQVCRPRAPLCHLCPLVSDCAFARVAERAEVLDGCSGQ